MFLASGGGVLGVGTPEVIVIAAVGYFVLGPTELYKLSKEVGKFVSNARRTIFESAAEWQSTMDSQFEIKEIKEFQDATRELQEAFSFRSDRYMQQWRDYAPPSRVPDPLAPAPTDVPLDVPQQLDVDEWNARILQQEAVVEESFGDRKQKALEEIELEYEQKRKQLDLEFEYERKKLVVALAAKDEELAQRDK